MRRVLYSVCTLLISPQPSINLSSKPTPTSTALPPAPANRHVHSLLSRTGVSQPALSPVVDLFADDDRIVGAPTSAPVPTAVPNSQPLPPASAAPQATAVIAATAPPTSTTGADNMFDLDFRAPTPSSAKPSNAKADIMSFYSSHSTASNTAPATQSFFSAAQVPSPYVSWGAGGTSSSAPVQQVAPRTTAEIAGWGGLQVDQGVWGAPVQATATNANNWGGNTDPWAASGGLSGNSPVPAVARKEERDPFANIWQ